MKNVNGSDAQIPVLLAHHPVHCLSELDIGIGQTIGLVCRQRHIYCLVDVEPFRMVPHFLGDESGAGHEPKRFGEIPEHEFLGDGVAVLDVTPAAELGHRRLTSITSQFLGHCCSSSHIDAWAAILTRIVVRLPLVMSFAGDYLTATATPRSHPRG